jgi:hypothetical protein
MKRTYEFRSKKGFGVEAAIAAVELERIRKVHKELRAADVVEAARPEDAPLHPAFTWDDGAAAERWRRLEARTLIRAIVVKVDAEQPRPVYEHVPAIKAGGGHYEPGELLVERPDMYALALGEALNALTIAQERVAVLRRYAEGDPDRAAVLVLAGQALQAAETAIRRLQ